MMPRPRGGLGGYDPLDAVLPGQGGTEHTKHTKHTQQQPARRVRVTFYLPADLLEQARDATVMLQGPPVQLTLSGLAEAGIRAELDRLAAEHNGGRPWPPRGGDLRQGRRIGPGRDT